MPKIINKIEQYSQPLIGSLVVLVVLLAATYIYFINQSVFSIHERGTAEEKISSLESEIAGLEANYISLTDSQINLAHAYKLGFQDTPSSAIFAVRQAGQTGLSMRSNEF